MPETALDRSYYILQNDSPVCLLDCSEAFKGMTEKEHLYTHFMSQASFHGALIIYLQTSPESALIYLLLQKLFRGQGLEEIHKLAVDQCGFTEQDYTALLVYASGISANSGNYKGFGDTKIVPGFEKEKFMKLMESSKAMQSEPEEITRLLSSLGDKMYSLCEKEQKLGFGNVGVTTYLSSNVDKADANFIDDFMKENKIEAWNTRLFKTIENGTNKYEIRLASIEEGIVNEEVEFKGAMVKVTKGDYSQLLKRVVKYLEQAQNHCENDVEKAMIGEYIKHFTTGSLSDHKSASRYWIQDKGPAIESYIGFIENYRDPAGTRSEFEGFVAAVNRETSKKFAKLVENAENLIERLPWPKEYEKDAFLKPDFTSLDVVSFGGSGIPAGINIPNYDEIRQKEGFKNVNLGNVIAAMPKQKLNFLTEEDEKLMRDLHKDSFEVQVGLHELLGHGSGKLFQKNKNGQFNFDIENVTDLETGGKVSNWYEEGETWSSKFGVLSSSYEECRAEAVGYVLSCYEDVLKIFGYEGEMAADVKYLNWLSEIRAGLVGLEYYSAADKKWGQAHCHARFALLEVVLEAGEGFVRIEETVGEDGKPDLIFSLDRNKIDSVGKPAVEAFLRKLQLYKSTGDFEKGSTFFSKYGDVREEALKWREIVIARRKPRRLFLQSNTLLNGQGKVELITYPETLEGMIGAQQDRYPDTSLDKDMWELWEKDNHWFL